MNLTDITTVATLALRDDGTYAPFSADAWGYAGQMTFLGMLMVFSVLGILWGVLAIFKLIFAPSKKKDKKAKMAEVVQSAVEESVEAVAASDDGGEELIAVITAAVAAYMSEESGAEVTPDGFRVVSFKRASGNRSWNSNK